MSLEVYAAYLTTEKRMTDNTKQAYLRDLRHFSNFAEARGIDDPAEASSTDILAYLMELKTGGRSKSTVNRKLASLRTYYQYLIKMREIFENPTESIKSPKVEKKEIQYLTTEEIDRLLELPEDTAKGKRDRAILELLYATGIRVSECVGLNTDDLNFEENSMFVTRKGGKEMILYFSDEVADALRAYLKEREQIQPLEGHEEALFLSLQKRRITQRAIENLVKKYAAIAAPLKRKISPHKLRSTYGTTLYNETGDIYLVADVLGHADVNTTRRHYAAMSDSRRRMAAKAVKLRDDAPEE